MKKVLILCLFSLVLLSNTYYAHEWEMMVRVEYGNGNLAQKTVRLYKTSNLYSPARQAISNNNHNIGGIIYNIVSDVLPSTGAGSVSWNPVEQGSYYIRIDDRYAYLYIGAHEPGSGDGDFYIRYNGTNFSLDLNNRGVSLGSTQNWVDPVSVNISGPTMLGFKESGVFTANATGGTGTYTYQWWKRNRPVGSWTSLPYTTKSISMTVSTTSIELKVKAASGGMDDYDTHYIRYVGDALKSPNEENAPDITITKLNKNYPNPFNPSTSITYQLKNSGFVTLKVYDVLGKEVATLVNGFQESGRYNKSFDASELASGIYIYRLHTGNFSQTNKMLLTK